MTTNTAEDTKNDIPRREDFDKTFEELKALVTDAKEGKFASKKNVEDLNKTFLKHVEKSQETTFAKQEELQKSYSEKQEKQQKEWLDEQSKAIQDRFDLIEAQLKRTAPSNDAAFNKKAEIKAVKNFMMKGEVEEKTLRTDVAEEGGVMVPVELLRTVRERREEISKVRGIINVETVGAKTVEVVVRTRVPEVLFVGECQEGPTDNSAYEVRQITNHAAVLETVATRDQLKFSTFDVEALLKRDVSVAYAKQEGTKVLRGFGSEQPEGILTNTEIAEFFSENSNDIDLQTIVQLPGQLTDGENLLNPIFAMNRRTFYSILSQQASGSGEFHIGSIFQPGNRSAQIPSLFVGEEFVLLNDIDDIGSNKFPILFGDFREAYTMYEVPGMEMIRDDVTQAKKRKVLFNWFMWWTGHVVIPGALVKYKIATSG